MNPNEVVVQVVDRQRCDVILDFLRERFQTDPIPQVVSTWGSQ
jgi:hypothetical protein